MFAEANLIIFYIVCFFLVSWVEGKLASNKTEEWIISEVDNICTVFPGFLGSEVCWRSLEVLIIMEKVV